MKNSLTTKILQQHLLQGTLNPGGEIAVRVHQTLTQDSTGTMVYLQLEAMEVARIKTELSVAYVDHNTIQAGFENADDHAFLKSAARKYGLIYSKPGGGICHQVHLERFSRPGAILLGSDSHTPTSGGLGCLSIGAGGLDVAVAMAKGLYFMKVPQVLGVRLTGALRPGVNAKDVILTVLQRLTVKGGVGRILEYTGPGAQSLSVTDRATICNMGAELGATTSLFESDERTLDFLTKQGRGEDYVPLSADPDAAYDEVLHLNLSEIQPMVALPHMPDNVVSVEEAGMVKVDQVAVGSCTNSSYSDMMKVAALLRGRRIHPDVDMVVAPGSSNILRLLTENGALGVMINAGARILESACGPCIGMGQAPRSGGVSLRSFNRNFKGRSGTQDASVYLVSPETAAASALTGVLTDPRTLSVDLTVTEPESFGRSDGYLLFPQEHALGQPVVMGPNIRPFPKGHPLPDLLQKAVLLKTGDNLTTDDIMPSGAALLPYRSNIPFLSRHAFGTQAADFAVKAEKNRGGIVVGGENYGQGSSREHAALVPLHLGVRAVLAKSFARIHRTNLINAGILPLVFEDPRDYDLLKEGEVLELSALHQALEENRGTLRVQGAGARTIPYLLSASPREKAILLKGGYLAYARTLPLEVTS